MTIRELREMTGMNRREFADYFHISYRTVQDWEQGINKCKDYIIRAFYYQLLYQKKIIEADSQEADEKM